MASSDFLTIMGISLPPQKNNRVILVSFDHSALSDFIVWLRSWEYSSTHTKHISSSSIPWLSCFFLMFQARSWGGGGGGVEGVRRPPPPPVRQKRSKNGPIFHACIGLSSTIHKKASSPPLSSPAFSKILVTGLCFGSFLSCFFGVVCCRVLASLVMAFVSSPVFSYGMFFWGVSQDCGCTTWLYHCYNLPLQNWYN